MHRFRICVEENKIKWLKSLINTPYSGPILGSSVELYYQGLKEVKKILGRCTGPLSRESKPRLQNKKKERLPVGGTEENRSCVKDSVLVCLSLSITCKIVVFKRRQLNI